MPQEPPMHVSDEAERETLDLARKQGETYALAVAYMTDKEAHGQLQPVGDYQIGVAVEDAEGMYVPDGDGLRWCDPDGNAHVEVVVADASDGRFVPGLEVEVSITRSGGDPIGTERQPFLWHPWLYHYGRNWTVPEEGAYDIHVRVEAPGFPRHDMTNGRRYTEPVDVTFQDVSITPGVKHSQDRLASSAD